MAHETKNLNLVAQGGVVGSGAGAQGRKWMLVTNDAAAVVEAANYLNASAGLLTKGDVIEATMARGGTPILKNYVVTAISAANVVTIALQSTAAG